MHHREGAARAGESATKSSNHEHDCITAAKLTLLEWACGISQASLFGMDLETAGANVQMG